MKILSSNFMKYFMITEALVCLMIMTGNRCTMGFFSIFTSNSQYSIGIFPRHVRLYRCINMRKRLSIQPYTGGDEASLEASNIFIPFAVTTRPRFIGRETCTPGRGFSYFFYFSLSSSFAQLPRIEGGTLFTPR